MARAGGLVGRGHYSSTDIIDAAIAAEPAHRAEGIHQREQEPKAVTRVVTA